MPNPLSPVPPPPPFCLYVLLTTQSAHAVSTYGYGPDHERFLQKTEIEYVLRLCDAWDAEHLWLVSSFRRHAVHYRSVEEETRKMGLVLMKTANISLRNSWRTRFIFLAGCDREEKFQTERNIFCSDDVF